MSAGRISVRMHVLPLCLESVGINPACVCAQLMGWAFVYRLQYHLSTVAGRGQTDRQTDRQRDRQTDRQIDMDRPNTGGKDTKKSRNKVEKNPNTGAKETYSPEKETYRPKRNVDCVRAVYTCTYMYVHVRMTII